MNCTFICVGVPLHDAKEPVGARLKSYNKMKVNTMSGVKFLRSRGSCMKEEDNNGDVLNGNIGLDGERTS